MAQTGYTPIQLYRSATAAATPSAGNLADGELALNTTDEKLYFKNAGGTVKLLASAAGSAGDVVGPGSATDSALVAFDGTTGKLIKQASTVTVAQGGTGQTTYTNGQLLIGNSTGNTLTKATLTAGSGVSITNGAGSITISATGTGGDVVGPASATDSALVAFNGTTGKLIKQAATVTVAQGGTGATSLTGVLKGNGTSAFTAATAGTDYVAPGTATTFTAAQTFRAANAIRSEAAATQDAVVVAGRAGGSSSYALTLTPATLSASRTATLPDGGGNYTVGYINLPPVGTKTGSYTLAVGDVGKYVQIGSSGSITIPTSTFAEGDAITLYNNTTGGITITCSAPTTYIAGTNTVKTSMTLATRGVATILFYSATACVVSGNVT